MGGSTGAAGALATGGLRGGSDSGGSVSAGGLSGAAGSGGEQGGAAALGGSVGTGGGQGGAAGGFAGASSLGDCQAKTLGSNSYLFCLSETTWTAARDGCASIGMHLVRVDNSDENQWLVDNIYDAGAPSPVIWIGGSDQLVEGEWRWSDDRLFWLGDASGSAQGGLFSAWYPAHPSSAPFANCTAIDYTNGVNWLANRCSNQAVFVCESQ